MWNFFAATIANIFDNITYFGLRIPLQMRISYSINSITPCMYISKMDAFISYIILNSKLIKIA